MKSTKSSTYDLVFFKGQLDAVYAMVDAGLVSEDKALQAIGAFKLAKKIKDNQNMEEEKHEEVDTRVARSV